MKLMLNSILVIAQCYCYGQTYTKASEKINSINQGSIYLGEYMFSPLYYAVDDRFTSQFIFFKLDENVMNKDQMTSFKFSPPFKESNWSSGFLRLQNSFDTILLYSVGYTNEDYSKYYQNLWLQRDGKDYFLDSIYNADKKIHSSFSSDGRYLLVNTLNTLSDYYNPAQDNQIMVYDLKNIDHGEIKKENIPCQHCSDSYLLGDILFFTIGRKDGYENFSNKDIYMAPWGKLQDTVKIASNTDIKSISQNGKYILGTRFWDRQKLTDVIVDVEQKKYQMVLGRDYAMHNAFYSYQENKFTYDFKGYLIYVDFPETYPFDALKWKNDEIPDWTEEEFWSQYEHPPLSKQ